MLAQPKPVFAHTFPSINKIYFRGAIFIFCDIFFGQKTASDSKKLNSNFREKFLGKKSGPEAFWKSLVHLY